MKTEFYVIDRGENRGPVPREQIAAEVQAGKLSRTALCWCEGMGDWGYVRDLFPRRRWFTLHNTLALFLSLFILGMFTALAVSIDAESFGEGLGYLVMLVISVAIYFAPAMLARSHKNYTAIVALNVFAGWTFVGWVAALVWALKRD